jgi:hypothetical protein
MQHSSFHLFLISLQTKSIYFKDSKLIGICLASANKSVLLRRQATTVQYCIENEFQFRFVLKAFVNLLFSDFSRSDANNRGF